MKLKAEDILKAVGGSYISEVAAGAQVNSVEFDTRKIINGALFIPLKGARDGHDFINVALDNGATLVLSERDLDSSVPYIKVNDTLKALQDLSVYYLNQVAPKVIGITGSNGKTTTKDMVAAVLETTYETYKTQGNYNNDIGLPYTILEMPSTTTMLVLEMGMDRKGEIEFLSKLAKPDVAAITMIGESHLEHLGTREGIAAAKMEIASGLKEAGLLIAPADEPLLEDLLIDIKQPVSLFGTEKSADIYGTVLSESKAELTFETSIYAEEVFSIPVLGSYNLKNALIAIIIGRYFSVSCDNIRSGLNSFDLTKNRTEWLRTKGGMDILSDVYNANPTAMNLVLDSFSSLSLAGKKVVVLGDMLELGPLSKEMHLSVAEHLDPEKINQVYLYGKEMKMLYSHLDTRFKGHEIHHYEKNEKDQLIKDLSQQLEQEDTVFLKASNGMGLSDVVDHLLINN